MIKALLASTLFLFTDFDGRPEGATKVHDIEDWDLRLAFFRTASDFYVVGFEGVALEIKGPVGCDFLRVHM